MSAHKKVGKNLVDQSLVELTDWPGLNPACDSQISDVCFLVGAFDLITVGMR